jgi:hypothetical protein
MTRPMAGVVATAPATPAVVRLAANAAGVVGIAQSCGSLFTISTSVIVISI